MRLIAAGTVLGALALRLLSSQLILPGWELDPLVVPFVPLGMTPGVSMLCDAVVLVASGVMLATCRAPDPRQRHAATVRLACMLLLLIVGALPVIWHGWLDPAAHLGDQRTGLAWISALAAGLAFCVSSETDTRRDDSAAASGGVRVLVLSSLAALACVMTIKGLSQVTIENAATVADFRANKGAVLAAQGLSPDSPMALAYARRVESNDPTVWMGLTNVFATFCAAGLGVLLILGLAMLSRAKRRVTDSRRDSAGRHAERGSMQARAAGTQRLAPSTHGEPADAPGHAPGLAAICLAAAAACAVGVVIAGSKGGYVVGLLSVAGALLWHTLHSRTAPAHAGSIVAGLAARVHRALPILGPALILCVLLAVVARGLLGERLGELSLYFRWFYMKAALAIGAANPLGVGPEGFKEAYQLAKDPLSPEEVASPHSVLLDWWACIGWSGLAWAALWLWWLAGASRALGTRHAPPLTSAPSLSPPPPPVPPSPARPTVRTLCTVAALATLGAILLNQAAIPPLEAGVRVLGLVAWLAVGSGAVLAARRAGPSAINAALALGAIVACIHNQIELGGSWTQSCGLFCILLATASGTGFALGAPHAVDAGEPPPAAPSAESATHDRASGLFSAVRSIASAVLLVGAVAAGAASLGTMRFERELSAAAQALAPIAELAADIRDPATGASSRLGESLRALADEWGVSREPAWRAALGSATGPRADTASPPPDGAPAPAAAEDRARMMSVIVRAAAHRSAARLDVLAARWTVAREQLLRESSRLHLAAASLSAGLGDDAAARAHALAAEERADLRLAPRTPDSTRAPRAEAFHWAASVRVATAAVLRDPERLARAAALFALASERDPCNPLHVARLLRTMQSHGDDPEILRPVARRLLILDANQRLDRTVRGLSPRDREDVERLAR